MNFLAFLFRMALRLALWLAALMGVLAILGVFAGLDIYRNHPGRMYDALNRAALHRLPSSSDNEPDDAFCAAVLNDLNRFAGMGSGTAYIVAAALNETGQCGEIEGGDIVFGLESNRFATRYFPEAEHLLRSKASELLRVTGLYGDPAFWHRLDSLEYCKSPSSLEFPPALFEAYLRDDDLGYREARLAWYQYEYSCREQLYELAVDYADDRSRSITEAVGSAMLGAEFGGNADAEWWLMRVLPTLDEERFGMFSEEGEPYDFDRESPCGSPSDWPVPQHYHYPNSPRDFAGRGHEEATREWLALGPYDADLEYWQCVSELNPDGYRHSFAWNGGYDTPFWYAVHAYRTQDPAGLDHLDQIASIVGEDCMDEAAEIGAGLRPLLPGPPVDVPELRAQILSAIDCQPEGLRISEAYGNADLWTGADGQYLPPELIYILPNLEPPFRRVEN